MSRSPAVLALLLAAALFPAAARAQRLTLTAGGFNVQRRVYLQNSVLEQTGVWIGGGGMASLGKLRLGVSGLMGTFKGKGNDPANAEVKARTTAVTLQVAFTPALMAGVQAEGRRFEADAGVTSWRLIGGRVRFEPSLGIPGLRGLADVAILPASSVSNGPSIKTALEATVGVSLAPPRSPLLLRLAYRFERFDVAAEGLAAERYEQFRGLVVEGGVRLGR
jgi:hypothetical protein